MLLQASDDRFFIEVPYELRHIAKAIPRRRWDPKAKVWWWPKNLVNFITIKTAMPSLQLERSTSEWVRTFSAQPVIKAVDPLVPHWDRLRDYQKYGVQFLRHVDRVLLADCMGLGKTPQSILAAMAMKAPVVLVLCPKSLIFNWEAEIQEWGAGEIVILDGPASARAAQAQAMIETHTGPRPLWFLTNWETVRLSNMGFWTWPIIIGDESHRIRNRKTQLSSAARNLKSDCLWLLSGTPIQNTAEDLWAQLNWLYPDQYTSFWDFFEAFVEYLDGFWGREVVGSKNLEALWKCMRPFALRRDKSVLGLEEKISVPVRVRLQGAQLDLYRRVEHDILLELESDEKLFIPTALARLTRLKQAATAPATFDQNWTGGSAKLEAALDLVQDNPDRQFVVYSQYTTVLDIFRRMLNCPVGFIHGKVSGKERLEIVNEFRSGSVGVLLATFGVGGEGLNFTPCSDVIMLDHWWNPQVMAQAEDRLHRYGQKEAVTVYNMIARSTVDEAIQKILEAKADTADRVMGPLAVLKEHYYGR